MNKMKRTKAFALLLSLACIGAWAGEYDKYYEALPVEVARVTLPAIPANEVSVADFGGTGDGVTLNTEAFHKAIDRLAELGGGKVTVPQGVWLTGPIDLKDNIELHVERGAMIYFTPDKRQYLGHSDREERVLPCIYAVKRTNIAITGEGTIDGNGSQWRPVKRNKQSDVEWKQYLFMGGTVTDDGTLWYPWQLKNKYPDIVDSPKSYENTRNDLMRLYGCTNILIKGVTVQNAPRFHVHPCNSRNVIIDGITVRCPWNAQNGDGIDFSDVNVGLIVNNTVDVGDDGICMKSSVAKKDTPASGCEDIVVQDNTVYHAHGGFVLGSNTTSGIRRMVVRHNRFSGTDTGLRFKSGLGRGGKTERLFISDILMSDIAKSAIVFQCDYSDHDADGTPKRSKVLTEKQMKRVPDFQDIHISNVICRGCRTGIKAGGLQGMQCVHDIEIENATIVYTKAAQQIDKATTDIKMTNVRLVADKKR
ncbi:MAG: glycoside hydrolase family 28 protein [Prevotella sp.]|nr:glycoside hydrolase family 28 protein [Prevotella sp.]